MNNDVLFTSTINDYLGMDHSGIQLNSLASNFHHAAYDLLQQISRSIDNKDHTAWLSHIHTLKGIAGIAGAKNLYDLCDSLRTRNNNTLSDTPIHIISALHNAIDDYQDAIHKTLNYI